MCRVVDEYLLKLIKSERNNFSEYNNTAHLFYFHSSNYGTTAIEIDYNIGEKIEVGSIYQDEYLNSYHILSKQYDNRNNIILLCKEVN